MGRFARRFKKKHRRNIMRRITLTPRQFNHFLFPAFVAPSQETQNVDPEIIVRLSRKIKDVSDEVPLGPQEQAMVAAGRVVFPDRRVSEDVSIDLETDEHRTLQSIYNANVRNFSVMAMEEAVEVQEIIRDAPDPQAAEVATAEQEFSVEE